MQPWINDSFHRMIFISGDNENKVIKGLNDVDEEMIVTDKPGVEPQLLPQRMDS